MHTFTCLCKSFTIHNLTINTYVQNETPFPATLHFLDTPESIQKGLRRQKFQSEVDPGEGLWGLGIPFHTVLILTQVPLIILIGAKIIQALICCNLKCQNQLNYVWGFT